MRTLQQVGAFSNPPIASDDVFQVRNRWAELVQSRTVTCSFVIFVLYLRTVYVCMRMYAHMRAPHRYVSPRVYVPYARLVHKLLLLWGEVTVRWLYVVETNAASRLWHARIPLFPCFLPQVCQQYIMSIQQCKLDRLGRPPGHQRRAPHTPAKNSV